jgi:hypothetical protein
MAPARQEETFDGCHSRQLIAVANRHARTAIRTSQKNDGGVCDLRKLGRLANMRQLDDALGVGSTVPETDAVALPSRLCDLSDNGGPDENHSSTDSSSLPVLRFNSRFCRKSARGHREQFLGWIQRSLVRAELPQQPRLQPFLQP